MIPAVLVSSRPICSSNYEYHTLKTLASVINGRQTIWAVGQGSRRWHCGKAIFGDHFANKIHQQSVADQQLAIRVLDAETKKRVRAR